MIVGVPREVKPAEGRVAMTPAGVEQLALAGHTVLVEAGAGRGSGFDDEAYLLAGAVVVDTAEEVWARSALVVKVKEPMPAEWPHLREGQVIFTFFHFAASDALTRAIIDSGCIAIAYETVRAPTGELPLLMPMSEVAGRLAPQQGAKYLEAAYGGRGMLLGGVPGTEPATVVVLGGGVVGANAARVAAGLGARVLVLDVSLPRLRHLAEVMPPNVSLLYSDRHRLREAIGLADVLVGAVLLPGARAPRLVTREDLGRMKPGSVIVDVAVDQGGCVETIRPTTHVDPVYLVDGIVHYGVANMPGAVPHTSTRALTAATAPYIRALADLGWREACRSDRSLLQGLNVVQGHVVYSGVAEAFGLELRPVQPKLDGIAVPVEAVMP